MSFYVLTAPSQKEVGGRGYGQIKLSEHIPWNKVNEKINSLDKNEIKEISKIEFELRHDAKVTDVITGVHLSFSLWFVNLNFLRCVENLNIYPYYIEPAKLSHRDKKLTDYFLFQFTLFDSGLELVDFPKCRFELSNRYTNQKDIISIRNKADYINILQQVMSNGGDIKLLKLVFDEGLKYDFFYLTKLPVGYVASESFTQSLIKHSIKGLNILKLSLDPYAIIW